MINQYKLTINRFTAELEEPLDRNLRTVVMTEVDIYETAEQDQQDGTFDKVYKAKVVGQTTARQGEGKPQVSKSKRSQSKKLRAAIWKLNPDEEFYEQTMNKIISNIEKIAYESN